jgi:hypothetical protein
MLLLKKTPGRMSVRDHTYEFGAEAVEVETVEGYVLLAAMPDEFTPAEPIAEPIAPNLQPKRTMPDPATDPTAADSIELDTVLPTLAAPAVAAESRTRTDPGHDAIPADSQEN